MLWSQQEAVPGSFVTEAFIRTVYNLVSGFKPEYLPLTSSFAASQLLVLDFSPHFASNTRQQSTASFFLLALVAYSLCLARKL